MLAGYADGGDISNGINGISGYNSRFIPDGQYNP
jgi:hypothetical protein